LRISGAEGVRCMRGLGGFLTGAPEEVSDLTRKEIPENDRNNWYTDPRSRFDS